jgi:hypothetical protein
MSDTTFVNGTVIVPAWLNDVNDTAYGANSAKIVLNIDALKALDKTQYQFAFVQGYYVSGDGGGGHYVYDAADTTSADNLGTIIVATDGGRWKLRYSGQISVKQFGAYSDGTNIATTTTALQAVRDFVASQDKPDEVLFPKGTYKYTASPNWGISDLKMTALGEVVLHCTSTSSTSNALVFDAGPSTATDYVWNMSVGEFIVIGESSSADGVYIRSVHHSKFALNVYGAGSTKAGMKVAFAVCTQFDKFICSKNEQPGRVWYAQPAFGMILTSRNAGETVSYCSFHNMIIEWTSSHGVFLSGTLGNLFLGGTSEACGGWGVFGTTAASYDRMYGVDFEFNTLGDIYTEGTNFSAVDCDSTGLIQYEGAYDRLEGGIHNSITIGSSAAGCQVLNPLYYRPGIPLPGTAGVVVTNASTAAGSPVLNFADTFGILQNMPVTGTNIPANTRVLSCTATTCTLTNNVTGAGVASGASITFGDPIGTFTDLGSYTSISNLRNYNTTYNYLCGKYIWLAADIGTINNGTQVTKTITTATTIGGSVVGFKLGDLVDASAATNLNGLNLWAYVSATDEITLVLSNMSGSSKTPADLTIRFTGSRPAIT